ncbi:MAG: biotin/lipoyl-containing protein [Candidatus Eisenbacteria bacterium]|nr:biotin/lipoyl-containing protein [Candidatus Eisenbacteria bacterium]
MPKLDRSWLWDGTSHHIQAELSGDHLYMELDGKPVEFSVVKGPIGSFFLRQGDRILTGYAAATAEAIWVQLDGRTYVFEPEKPPRAGSGPGGPTGGDVLSPMTGTVRKVFAESGQAVAAGAPLLVVEAMKMEYTVTAPGEGRVAELLCSVGQPVDLGQLLVRFEAAPATADQ